MLRDAAEETTRRCGRRGRSARPDGPRTAKATRPRILLADSGADHWLARKSELGPGEGLRIAGELRLLVAAQRPDWPRAEQRAADLEVHARVGESLRRVLRRSAAS